VLLVSAFSSLWPRFDLRIPSGWVQRCRLYDGSSREKEIAVGEKS
jgi:hypothetical protein